jgi:hypothetical protein
MQAYRTLDLPCPWAPLQSIPQRLVDDSLNDWNVAAYLRGKAADRLESFHYVSGCGAPPRRSAFHVFDIGRGKPQTITKPECSKRKKPACDEPRPKPGFDTQHRHGMTLR